MDKCMAEQKHLASEKAMEKLDPASVQEVLENDWLKNEAAAHRQGEGCLLSETRNRPYHFQKISD